MGPKLDKDQIVAGAVAVATRDGLSRLSFGRVAKELGTSDRMVVYYLPTKDALVAEVLVAVGLELQAVLARAFTEPAADHRALVRAAWPVVARPERDPLFALFFEALGLAAAGIEPYRALADQLFAAWIDWLAPFVQGAKAHRRAEAEAALAVLDGLLLLRQVAGPQAANRAARAAGVA